MLTNVIVLVLYLATVTYLAWDIRRMRREHAAWKLECATREPPKHKELTVVETQLTDEGTRYTLTNGTDTFFLML